MIARILNFVRFVLKFCKADAIDLLHKRPEDCLSPRKSRQKSLRDDTQTNYDTTISRQEH